MPSAAPRTVSLLLAGIVLSAGTIAAQTPNASGAPAAGDSKAPTTAPGRITGRILDGKTGNGLSDVGIQILGSTVGAMSGVDGHFTLNGVPAGTVSLQIRRIGYQAKTVTGIVLASGKTVEENVTMLPATVQLQAVSVTASAEKGTVNQALDRQRSATGIVNSITAEQIAKSPDRDAAQAVQRVSGVTVSEGKYVLVRGLGERYTTTSLNGTRLPSPEPERKVVPLDLFPSALLQSVTTSKTFTPDQAGDFTGAQVNIETREFPTRRMLTFTGSTGFNSAATGRNIVNPPLVGTEWLGLGGSARSIPSAAHAFNGSVLDPANSRLFVGDLRNAWTPSTGGALPNSAFGASLGGQTPVMGHSVGYVGSLSYAYNQDVRQDELRQLVVGGGPAKVRALNTYQGSTGRQSVLWGGIANFSTMLGDRSHIAFNNMYNRSADNEAHLDEGFDETQSDNPDARKSSVRRTWLDFVERTVRSDQLRGEHSIGDRNTIDWTLTSSEVTRREPDRTDVFYRRNLPTDPYLIPLGNPKGARRLHQALNETVLSPQLDYRLNIGPVEHAWQFKFGSLLRETRRTASLDPFFFTSPNATEQELTMAPEQLFPVLTSAANRVTVERDPDAGRYTARDRVLAGYGMTELPIGERLRLIAGARVEQWRLQLGTMQHTGQRFDSTYTNTDVLPSVALNVKLTDAQTLRLSASRTLSRPEYRELSPLQEKGPIGDLDFVGNPNLRRALVNNYDLRWEQYPNPGEILSVALFAKHFQNPIERVQVSTNGGNIYSFVNANGADNLGIELEARKSLAAFSPILSPFTGFTNVTLMKSKITPGNTDISALTSADRAMVGQAPYVVNAGLAYANASGRVSATALYNVIGASITATGTKPTPDTYLQPRHMLDLSLQLPVSSMLSAKINARNLLDSPYEERTGTVTRMRYRSGRVMSVGFAWTPSLR
jgi:outer membrane receptor protein involved in Fe transport